MKQLLLFLLCIPFAFALFQAQLDEFDSGYVLLVPESEPNLELIEVWADAGSSINLTIDTVSPEVLVRSYAYISVMAFDEKPSSVRLTTSIPTGTVNDTSEVSIWVYEEYWKPIQTTLRTGSDALYFQSEQVSGEYFALTIEGEHKTYVEPQQIVEEQIEEIVTEEAIAQEPIDQVPAQPTTQEQPVQFRDAQTNSVGPILILVGIVVIIIALGAGLMSVRKHLKEKQRLAEELNSEVGKMKQVEQTILEKMKQYIADQKSSGYIVNQLLAENHSYDDIVRVYTSLTGKPPHQ